MGKLYAISDIHGYFDEFQALLNHVNFSLKHDSLISCGDMIDRGPKGREVVEWFKKMKEPTKGRIQAIFGNHEYLFLSYITGKIPKRDYEYTVYGGSFTLDSYKGNETFIGWHSDYIASLPMVIELGDIVFCHAKINPKRKLTEQTAYDTLWDYNKEFYTTNIARNDGKVYIFGHTPTYYINKDLEDKSKRYEDYYEAIRVDNKICIDCSYYNKKKMCLYDIIENVFYYYDFETKSIYMKDTIKSFEMK